jgi:beta-phosphoglucomutase
MMNWTSNYQLFLFDFDGLLVDTEQFHYQAYIDMCRERGFQLTWDFARYSVAAHHGPTDLRDQIYAEFPGLQEKEPDWRILYAEKKKCFMDLIEKKPVPLMSGVKELLLHLDKNDVKRCVVTHSPIALIESIRKKNPVLDSIPLWITREEYEHPKPHPECYQLAIAKLAGPTDRIIGFEDSPRGMHALMQTKADPVLICPPQSAYIGPLLRDHPHIRYYSSFCSMKENL